MHRKDWHRPRAAEDYVGAVTISSEARLFRKEVRKEIPAKSQPASAVKDLLPPKIAWLSAWAAMRTEG